MKTRRWLLLLLIMIVAMMSMATYTGVTSSLFTDGELSTDNALGISWAPAQTLLNDSFDGTPWDANWDGNGTTSWAQDTTPVNTGPNSASADKNSASPGWLTSDDLNATSGASITVSFWFYGKGLDALDAVVEVWDGTGWASPWNIVDGFGDLTTLSGYANTTWFQFSDVITDPLYFTSTFKIRFNSSGLTQGGEAVNIDDVLIVVNY